MSSLLDSPFILANDPEAEEILVVVGGLEGSVLTRRHSWISPRFNAQIFLLPLCPGTVATGAPVWSARSVFGGRAPTHPKVGERLKYPVLGTDPLLSSLALVLTRTTALHARARTTDNFGQRTAGQKIQPED